MRKTMKRIGILALAALAVTACEPIEPQKYTKHCVESHTELRAFPRTHSGEFGAGGITWRNVNVCDRYSAPYVSENWKRWKIRHDEWKLEQEAKNGN